MAIWLILFGAGVWCCAGLRNRHVTRDLGWSRPADNAQAGTNSIAVLVMAPGPIYGFDRWIDAAIGSTLALLVATVAPSGPLRKPGEVAAKVVAGMADTLEAAANALAAKDEHAASAVLERVQATEKDLATFDVAAAEASKWSAIPLFADDSWAWQSHCPACTSRSILPSATFGYWCGAVLSQYGGR